MAVARGAAFARQPEADQGDGVADGGRRVAISAN